jgi:hypothetical protein
MEWNEINETNNIVRDNVSKSAMIIKEIKKDEK